MKLETFFDKFDFFADAPDGVRKLRQLVLQLAVQGQLVDHRAEDGDARSIFSGVAVRGVASPEVDARYPVPSSWCWTRFAAVGEQRLGKMLDQKGNRGELKPYLRNTNVQWMRIELDDVKQLRLEPDELEEYRLQPGDLLICEGGEPGRCAIWRDPNREMYFQKALHRVRPRKGVLADYLAICLQVDAQNGVLERAFTGSTIKHFTGRSLSEYSVPIPPPREQKRIVAKVDELMALSSRLEAQQQGRETRRATLAHASLARFGEAPSAANLNFLFHDSYAIEVADLRQSILALAVQGKLVPQKRDEQSAVPWLPPQPKVTPPSNEKADDTDFSLPSGWARVTMEDVFEVAGGIQKTPLRAPRKNAFPYLGVANVQRGQLDLANVKLFELKPGELERRRLQAADLLIIEGNGSLNEIGRCAIWNGEIPNCVHQNHVIRCRPFDLRISSFTLLVLNSPIGIASMQRLAITTAGLYSLSVGRIRQIGIPMPPIREQARIVARVNELMTLVDQLEAQLDSASVATEGLTNAILTELAAQV